MSYVLTIQTSDIGKTNLKSHGVTYRVGDVIGPVQICDIGKRVYEVDGILQVENNEQRDARMIPSVRA